jgi:2-oxoglutarate dehydrogenase E2 component (dihydrolipoamide succinyltransferase)
MRILADLETDKVVLEVPAPVAGVIKSLDKTGGTTVTSGELLAVIDEQASAAAAPKAPAKAEAKKPEAKKPDPAPAPARCTAQEGRGSRQALAGRATAGRGKQIVRRADRGQRTRRAHLKERCRPSPRGSAGGTGPGSWRWPHRPARADVALRARIAQRLVEAQSTAALLTTFNEIDMQALMALRSRYKDAFEKRHGVRLGFMSFFAKACVEALRRFPVVNASVEGGDVVYHEYFDLGVAVSTDRGLIVPVLRDADRMDFAAIEKAVTGFAERARSGTITIEELTGGTFSITNGGVFGSLMSTPIVNAPQSADPWHAQDPGAAGCRGGPGRDSRR